MEIVVGVSKEELEELEKYSIDFLYDIGGDDDHQGIVFDSEEEYTRAMRLLGRFKK